MSYSVPTPHGLTADQHQAELEHEADRAEWRQRFTPIPFGSAPEPRPFPAATPALPDPSESPLDAYWRERWRRFDEEREQHWGNFL